MYICMYGDGWPIEHLCACGMQMRLCRSCGHVMWMGAGVYRPHPTPNPKLKHACTCSENVKTCNELVGEAPGAGATATLPCLPGRVFKSKVPAARKLPRCPSLHATPMCRTWTGSRAQQLEITKRSQPTALLLKTAAVLGRRARTGCQAGWSFCQLPEAGSPPARYPRRGLPPNCGAGCPLSGCGSSDAALFCQRRPLMFCLPFTALL